MGAVGGEGLDVQAKTHVVSRNCLLTTRLTRLESLGITGFPQTPNLIWEEVRRWRAKWTEDGDGDG